MPTASDLSSDSEEETDSEIENEKQSVRSSLGSRNSRKGRSRTRARSVSVDRKNRRTRTRRNAISLDRQNREQRDRSVSRDPSLNRRHSGSLRSLRNRRLANFSGKQGKLTEKVLEFLEEVSRELQMADDRGVSPAPIPMNEHEKHWEELKDRFPLPAGAMDRLQETADKFANDPKYTNDLGYPTNQSIQSSEWSELFDKINLNNIGSPYNLEEMGCIRNTREYEREILDMVAEATGIHANAVTGYITHGGTEAALYGIWNAQQRLDGGVGTPRGSVCFSPVMFYSAESHYSCAKIANILGMESESVATIKDSGAMDVARLRE